MRYVLWAILFYVLYRFVVGFVIPVFKVTRQMKKQMNEFKKAHMENQPPPYSNEQETNNARNRPPFTANKTDEYIDFEEIKN
ncbi:hypothetical protein [Gynurincola endophyticus]|jgi:uncharacterized protein YneF (UPF0154 family)|uniref:hypothetical protein n=1 Tax=Gynurincola endophyticus TaxID=2479004 RepID=UPI000F8D6A0F|nr:hypothetical protein [Gynurincola endophyticus]